MGFQQGLSGLNAASKNLDVIGNNVANASTVGFKSSRAEFEDVYAAALSGAGVNNVGIGVNVSAISQQFTQGNVSTTENPLDLALNGPGFFQVTDGLNPTLYTRNGQFKVDREGFIVNNDNLKLVGYPADGQGVIQPGIARALQLPTAGIDPNQTSEIALEFNLDSRLKTTSPAGTTGVLLDDPTTYNNATSLSVFDAKGQEIALTLYIQKGEVDVDGNTPWHVYATANGVPLAVDSAGNAIPVDADNNPQTPWTIMIFPRTGGAPTTPVAGQQPAARPAEYGHPGVTTNSVGAQTRAITGMAGRPARRAPVRQRLRRDQPVLQDGYAPGQLSGVTVESDGVVMARYSNGQSKPAGQIELATFRNPQGLQPLGGNAWARSSTLGRPGRRACRATATWACCRPARSRRATSTSPPSW
jgi:flagellar hook protein FlgE